MAVIEKIKLPGGAAYDLRDASAIHDVFDSTHIGAVPTGGVAGKFLSGDGNWVDLTGITFNIAWDGSAAPVVANIPAGVKVTYNSTEYTGTLAATSATEGCFYLVKSASEAGQKDIYDEYVVVNNGGTKSWEKIGDTTVSVSFNKITKYLSASAGKPGVTVDAKYIKASATQGSITQPAFSFTPTTTKISASATQGSITQPAFSFTPTTVHLKATATQGVVTQPTITVTPSTTKIKATASGGGAAWNNKDAKTALTGVKISSQGSVKLEEDTASTPGTNSFQVVTGITSASASGGSVSWNSKDQKLVITSIGTVTDPSITLTSANSTSSGAIAYAPGSTACTRSTDVAVGANGTASAITGLGTASTDNVLGEATTFSTTVTPSTTYLGASASGGGYDSPTNSVEFVKSYPGTTSKLVTETIYSKSSGDNGSDVSANLSNWTFSVGTGDDANTLIIGGGNGDTVTANKSTWAFTSKTSATGALATDGDGSSVMTGLGTATKGTAITALGTFTAPSVSLSSNLSTASGRVQVATGISSASTSAVTSGTGSDVVAAVTGYASPSTETVLTGVKVTTQPAFTTPVKYLTASASGTAVAAGGTASVIGASSTMSLTAPSVTVTPELKYVKATPSGITAAANGTASVIGASSTFTNTQPTVTISSGSTGDVTVATGISSASASGGAVAAPTIALSAATSAETNVTYDVATGGSVSRTTNVAVGNPSVTIASGDTGDVTVATGGFVSRTTDVAVAAPTVTIEDGTSSNGYAVGANGAVDSSNITAPTVTLTVNDSTASGRVTYVQDVSLS